MNTLSADEKSEKTKNHFQPKIYHLVESTPHEDIVIFLCLNIMTGLCAQPVNSHAHHNLAFMFKYSQSDEHQKEDFLRSVYILAHGNVNAIYQKFHYFDELTDFYRDLPNSFVYECYDTERFTDPNNGQEISKQQFNEVVFPYFCVTDEFIHVYGGEL